MRSAGKYFFSSNSFAILPLSCFIHFFLLFCCCSLTRSSECSVVCNLRLRIFGFFFFFFFVTFIRCHEICAHCIHRTRGPEYMSSHTIIYVNGEENSAMSYGKMFYANAGFAFFEIGLMCRYTHWHSGGGEGGGRVRTHLHWLTFIEKLNRISVAINNNKNAKQVEKERISKANNWW